MAKKKKQTIVDDVVNGVRRMLEELDKLANPQKRVRQPVPVPVRYRPDPRRQPRDPYR